MSPWQINSENEDELYDIAEEVDEQFEESGGGGGGGSDKQGKKTKQAKKKAQIKHSQEKRKQETIDNLKRVIGYFPEFDNKDKEQVFLDRYISWINACLQNDELIFNEGSDVELKFARSGKKAGGQNVNKVSSAAICKHVISNITVRNEETRSQRTNREKAITLLKNKLANHIEDWKIYLDGGELSKDKLKSL